MNEKELGDALLKWDASATSSDTDPRHLTGNILSRDRRRLRLLAGITIFFWLAAAAVIFSFLFSFLALYSRIAPQNLEEAEPVIAAVYKFMLLLAGSVEALVLAALCTILLVFVSRRATLRQVNANLIKISEQLKQLRLPPTK